MKLNVIRCLVFYVSMMVHVIFSMELESRLLEEADFLDHYLKDMEQQDRHFTRENVQILQRAQEWICELNSIMTRIDLDAMQLQRSIGKVCYVHSDCRNAGQKGRAELVMLDYTKREFMSFTTLLQTYTSAMEEAALFREGHDLIGHYIGTLNALFNVWQSPEEIQLLQESMVMDRARYALSRTRSIMQLTDLCTYRQKMFESALKSALEPYNFCPRAPGPYLFDTQDGHKKSIHDYLFTMMHTVFQVH